MVNAREVSFVDQGSRNGSKVGKSSFKSRYNVAPIQFALFA
jgi:hypothetical protein